MRSMDVRPDISGRFERQFVPLAGPSPTRSELVALAMDRMRRGILIIDPQLQLLYCNDAANQILLNGDAVLNSAGQLVLLRRDVMGRLERFLAGEDSASEEGADLALRLERSNGEQDYRMWVSPLSRCDDNGEPETYLVMLFNPDTAFRIAGRMLTDLYGLTRTEACVAIRLFEGMTICQLAADMKISANTARTHLRSIFRKCEVDSQSHLLQLLSLGPRGM